MDNVKVEPAVESYRTETEKAWNTVLKGFADIGNALNDLNEMPNKYSDLEAKLLELAGTAFGDAQTEKLNYYKVDRQKYMDFLDSLDLTVTAADLMLI